MIKKLKICGITTLEILEAAEDADYLGFVIGSPKSRRNLEMNEFEKLISKTSRKTVAVTVSGNKHFLKQIDNTGVDIIQLHGKARDFRYSLQSKVAMGIHHSELDSSNFSDLEYLSVDNLNNGYGGSGKTWVWKPINNTRVEVLLSGGISFSNVKAALDVTGADGVDLSSSVEIGGKKSPLLVRQIIEKVQSYDRTTEITI
ncbi:MAG: hypothetical protein INQ03_20215 [Candidatus Heimdallarchaeota archaeon]|nr:hypothetical protein [Candidatus Heimdallarchaeota archaeon]